MQRIPEFDKILRKTAWRMKLQAVIERVTTTTMLAVVTLLIGLYYYKTYALGASDMWVFLVLAGSWLFAGVVWGLSTKTPASAVASRLDETCGLNDALGSAIEFYKAKENADPMQRAFMEMEIRRAKKVLSQASERKAAPFKVPRDAGPTAILLLFLVGFVMVDIPLGKARAMIAPPTKEEIPMLKVDSARLNEHKDLIDDLKKRAEELDDKELKEFLKKQADLIEEMKKGKLPRRDFLKEYSKLMNKYFKGEEDLLRNFEKMKDVFKKAAEPFLKNKISKDFGEALKKGEMEKARKELEKLVKKMEEKKLTKRQERQLKKAFEKAAEKLKKDKEARQLAESLDRQSRQLRKEANKLDNKIKRLEQQKKGAKDQQTQKKINKLKEKKRQIDQQRKKVQQQKRMVQSLKKQMEKAGQQKMSKEMQAEMKKLMKEMSKYRNQAARSGARQSGRMSLKDLRELLKRMRAQQKRGGKGKLNDFLDRARGRKPGRSGKPGGGQCKDGKGGKGGKGPGRLGLKPGSGQGKGQGLSKGKGDSKGGKDGAGEGGKKWGTTPGGDPKGRETSMDSTRHEKFVKGEEGKGPSDDQVVTGSAEKGFNTSGYRKLYVRYRKLQKEVLQEEDIPAGYRYHIKRYFRLIRSRK